MCKSMQPDYTGEGGILQQSQSTDGPFMAPDLGFQFSESGKAWIVGGPEGA